MIYFKRTILATKWRRLGGGVGWGKKWDKLEIVHMRDGGSLDYSRKSRDVWQMTKFGIHNILKVNSIAFGNGLNVGCKRKRWIKDDSNVLILSNTVNGGAFYWDEVNAGKN